MMFAFVFRTIQSQIKPCLDKLNSDPDIDVKYFAQEALGGKETCLHSHTGYDDRSFMRYNPVLNSILCFNIARFMCFYLVSVQFRIF